MSTEPIGIVAPMQQTEKAPAENETHPRRFGQILSEYVAGLLDKKPSTGEVFVELDGLRGFAVFLVLASHSDLFHLRGQGAVGVWLFFVLSGFLLTNITLRKVPESLGVRELAKYVVRRIARILPAYYTALILITLLEQKSGMWLFRHMMFMQADGHFWSIPQEELFYLLLPAFAAVIYWLNRFLRLPPLLLAGALLLGAVVKGFPFFTIPGNGGPTSFYIDIFMMGFFLAHLWQLDPIQRLRKSREFLPFANIGGVICFLVMLLGAKEQLTYYGKFIPSAPADYLGWLYPTRYAVICAVLLFVTLTPGSWTQRLFSCRGFRVVGVLSFGLYLLHYNILLTLLRRGVVTEGFALFATVSVLSLISALVLERFVERPSMRVGRWINSRLNRGSIY
ncbi:MAG TPA: acyltransferase [Lacunisphaera sp.]|jgi:peptidoglycan/LPS O-acetylase OafA/YrhL